MKNSQASIIVKNPDALRVVASAARISTQQGTALELYGNSRGDERDLRLIGKVLSSGHKSVVEHQTFSVAFNNVSVLVEQYVIESRLASFTVKSRRYVDFTEAGYVVPEGLSASAREQYEKAMSARFSDYERLLELGIPREDARFVLPYCLRSNFYMTLNARELIGLICGMLYGRGKGYPEIRALGAQLKAQFDACYPGIIDREADRYGECASAPLPQTFRAGECREGNVRLVEAPDSTRRLLEMAGSFSGRFEGGEAAFASRLHRMLTDARPRELELAVYTFLIERVSLACVTHFTRHRMLSIMIPPVAQALSTGDHVLPQTVQDNAMALEMYENAFRAQTAAAGRLQAQGMAVEDLSYFALSGHQVDLVLTLNLRELVHFLRLRTCRRAQWEIREIAWKMLALLRAREPEIFDRMGPSCVYGPCPEGRMSCGKPYRVDLQR
ncbi:MAG: FAD-dependent thymidylate synthase [Clostridia bacterium]|nr:FAD-dependent thymidylate synthase [Clostridia bacterium]